MGWLFGWNSRKDLIDHLVSGNGIKTLRHCCKGNNLWTVEEGKNRDGVSVRYVGLYMMRGGNGRDAWGYKSLDESSGPYYYNCPLSYLNGLPEPIGYAADWRENVRKYHADRTRKFAAGTKIRLFGRDYTVSEKLKSGYRVHGADGCVYRMPVKHISHVEVLA